jgi:hypothetical protein
MKALFGLPPGITPDEFQGTHHPLPRWRGEIPSPQNLTHRPPPQRTVHRKSIEIMWKLAAIWAVAKFSEIKSLADHALGV